MKRLSIFILLNLMLLSCGRGESPVTVITSVNKEFDSWEDCLNGLAVASLEGKWGVVSYDGRTVVPLEFEDVYMLTDELIAAFKGTDCEIFSRNGARLSEIQNAKNLASEELLSRYNAVSSKQGKAWEKVVSDYERLCAMASTSAPIGDIRSLADSIKLEVNSIAGGSLSEADIKRVEVAYKEAMQ